MGHLITRMSFQLYRHEPIGVTPASSERPQIDYSGSYNDSGYTQYSWLCQSCGIYSAIQRYDALIHCWCYLPSSRLHPRQQVRHVRPLWRLRHAAGTAELSAPNLYIGGTQHVVTFSRCIVYTCLILIDYCGELEVESPSSSVTITTVSGPCYTDRALS